MIQIQGNRLALLQTAHVFRHHPFAQQVVDLNVVIALTLTVYPSTQRGGFQQVGWACLGKRPFLTHFFCWGIVCLLSRHDDYFHVGHDIVLNDL